MMNLEWYNYLELECFLFFMRKNVSPQCCSIENVWYSFSVCLAQSITFPNHNYFLTRTALRSNLVLINMESIVLMRKHLALCGADIVQKSTQNHPFNVRNVAILFLNCATVSLVVLSFNQTTDYEKRIDVLLQSISTGACGIITEIIVWKTPKLFEFFNTISDTIKNSEFIRLRSPTNIMFS